MVSDEALTSAREVLLHADSSDRLLGAERLDRLGVRARRIAAGGTPEDIALLVAHHADASLIVTVGTHTTPRGVPRPAALRDVLELPHPAAAWGRA